MYPYPRPPNFSVNGSASQDSVNSNMISNQMQGLKLTQSTHPGSIHGSSQGVNPSYIHLPSNPLNSSQFGKINDHYHSNETVCLPSALQRSKGVMPTNVTYSGQPRATYPYSTNSMPFTTGSQTRPSMFPTTIQTLGPGTDVNFNQNFGDMQCSPNSFDGYNNHINDQNTVVHPSTKDLRPVSNQIISGPPSFQTSGVFPVQGILPNAQRFQVHRLPMLPSASIPHLQGASAERFQSYPQPIPSSTLQAVDGQKYQSYNAQPMTSLMSIAPQLQLPGMASANLGAQSFQHPHSSLGFSPSSNQLVPLGQLPQPLPGPDGMQFQTTPFQGAAPYGAQLGYGGQVPPNQQPHQPKQLYLDQLPSIVQVREEDKQNKGGIYATDVKGQPPPLVTTNFIAQDRGICNPRFMRSSMYCLPNHPDMLKQTGIPFAIVVSPLAHLNEGENDPPPCLYREDGPLRCQRCKAYMCPFMTFTKGGRSFQCSFCNVVNEVPQDYFCFLDGMGERTDKFHRPELCFGSYEFLASKDYCRNSELPNPPAYIFMIEVSCATFRNGMVQLLFENMKNILSCLKNNEKNNTSKVRVGFVTYSNVLHFYNLKKNFFMPHVMVLSDVHNAFVPLLDGFLVALSEAESFVDCLMEQIPRLFLNEPATEIVLGPVVQVGLEALKNVNCAGKLLVFHSTIPSADAPGQLQPREGQKLLGSDKQKTVLLPQNDFYTKLAQDCVAAGCCVDLFLFPSSYIDIATISPLCRHTGGQIYKYTYFQAHIDGDRFLEDVERNLSITTAFDAVLRIRTSAGISPVFNYGNFYMSNVTDLELSAMDCHKAITVELAYDDKLPENETVRIQAALLYTTCTGERRIRIHNLAISTSQMMADVYRCCELDTIINFEAKQALKKLLIDSPQHIKSTLVNRTVKMLYSYRKNCTTPSTSGQLVLPDTLKLLPLYASCLLKSDALSGGPDISLDDRSFAMIALNSMDAKSTANYFYPTLIALHNVDVTSSDIPVPIRCSTEKLSEDGAYLLENGIYMFIWIGRSIHPEWLQNVLGVESTNAVDKQKTYLPELSTPLSKRVRQIVESIAEERQWYMRLTIMLQGDKLEIIFRQFLVEDRGLDGSPSYVEFLCHIHKEITKLL